MHAYRYAGNNTRVIIMVCLDLLYKMQCDCKWYWCVGLFTFHPWPAGKITIARMLQWKAIEMVYLQITSCSCIATFLKLKKESSKRK